VFPFSLPVLLLEKLESVTSKYSGEQEETKEKHTTTQSSLKSFSVTWNFRESQKEKKF